MEAARREGLVVVCDGIWKLNKYSILLPQITSAGKNFVEIVHDNKATEFEQWLNV
jgi:hypothetical protein